MNTQQLPSIELVQGTPPPVPADQGPRSWRRWKVFLTVFLVVAAIGLAIVYSRSPVYRASASVLTVKAKAVDQRSAEADIEHVAIQKRLLLGEELLDRLSTQLEDNGDALAAGVDALRNTLSVIPVVETNLLELRAEGDDPGQLQRVVNRWAESYETFRAEEIEAATGRTTSEIEDERNQLDNKIEAARGELQAFREANEIVGLEREENRSMASLKGLNNSLNKAREKLVDARAQQAAVQQAIARGDMVVPNEQKQQITELRLEVERVRALLGELRQQYTQSYMDRDPKLKALPNFLRAKQSELRAAEQIAQATVSDEAARAVESARLSVVKLEQQLTAQQSDVQLFNERYKTFKKLEENLARLETLYADNGERLAQIQVKNLKKYPPIQIVEWAREPTRPIYPDYERDLMIALGIALGTALFVTWLVEYLSEKEKPGAAHGTPQIGVRIYPGDQAHALPAQPAQPRLDRHTNAPPAAQMPPPNLPVLPRELGGTEVQNVLAASDSTVNGYAALLLSGVSPYELPLLHGDCFDRHAGAITMPGASARSFSVGPGAWQRIDAIVGDMDDAQMKLRVAELDQRLNDVAQQLQVGDARGVNALALWHTYVVYLVRQGIDESTLSQRVGAIPRESLDALMNYAPPGAPRPPHAIDFTYPALAY